jgi:hypothetical protein
MTDDYDSERRRQMALERLGTNTPTCVFCNENNPHCLERHHYEGRNFSTETVIVCRNCHRKLEDARKNRPSTIACPPVLDERIENFLYAAADCLAALLDSLRKYAQELGERTRSGPDRDLERQP